VRSTGSLSSKSFPHDIPTDPESFLNLPVSHPQNLLRIRGSGEPQHQRPRKRPRLTTEIPNVSDINPDLLPDLPSNASLQRLTGLDEPG
jgi:hypothetical protein